MEKRDLVPATTSRDELNDFTANIRIIARSFWPRKYWVKLRNGTLVRPEYTVSEDETNEDFFFEEVYKYCWNLDGTNLTNRDLDMVEIVRNV